MKVIKSLISLAQQDLNLCYRLKSLKLTIFKMGFLPTYSVILYNYQMNEILDESSFIKRFKKGDAFLFEQFVLKYQHRIFNLCLYMLGDTHDAEDAAQDTFIKAYQNLKNFKPKASFYTWLYRIAVNTCIDYKRRPIFDSLFRKSKDGNDFSAELPSDIPSPERLYESKQTGYALQAALKRLSKKLRAAIILKEIEGLSYEDIAEVLDISMGTVKSRISRAREELKKLMKEFMEQN
jgi:RNA polymerase sigma-70 factor (ECF subfamily)